MFYCYSNTTCVLTVHSGTRQRRYHENVRIVLRWAMFAGAGVNCPTAQVEGALMQRSMQSHPHA